MNWIRKKYPDRTIRWEIEALPGNQGGQQATLEDLNDPAGAAAAVLNDALVRGNFSIVRADFTFPHPTSARPWVHAGDRFKLRAIATTDDGDRIIREIFILIVPGEKVFHVSNPDSQYDPFTVWRLADDVFAQWYGNSRIEFPLSSDARLRFRVGLLDKYRNALLADVDYFLKLQGSGRLAGLDPRSDSPNPAEYSVKKTLPGGIVEDEFVQIHYGSCPWQEEPELDTSEVIMQIDSRMESITQSVVERTEPLPPRPGPIEFRLISPGTIATNDPFLTPEIYQREIREFVIEVSRQVGPDRVFIQGAEIRATSLNGKLAPKDGRYVTGQGGRATIRLTSEDAVPGPITVMAQLGTKRLTVSFGNMRWVTSAQSAVFAEKRTLIGDETQDGMICVETLQDRGERLVFPNAVEGDFQLCVEYYALSTINIQGAANQIYSIDIMDNFSWAQVHRYPFDSITSAATSVDVRGQNDAQSITSQIDNAEFVEGLGSMRFAGTQTLELPGRPTLSLPAGLLISFWLNPAEITDASILKKLDEYELLLLGLQNAKPGHLRFEVQGQGPQGTVSSFVESEIRLTPNVWQYVEVRYDGSKLRLSVGREKDRLTTSHEPVALQFTAGNTAVIVGNQLKGNIDDLLFVKGGIAQPLVQTVGLLIGGQIQTDASGRATFQLQSNGVLPQDSHLPYQIRIEATGSETAEAIVQVIKKDVWGHMVNMGKAFLTGDEGLGEDADWFQKSAAWVSEMIPFLADLRTLGYEIYKGATGCDTVSLMNVSFAFAGLISDAVSFGTAGVAIRAARLIIKQTLKKLLKEFATNAASSLTSQFAISTFARLYLEEVTRAECAEKGGNPQECGQNIFPAA